MIDMVEPTSGGDRFGSGFVDFDMLGLWWVSILGWPGQLSPILDYLCVCVCVVYLVEDFVYLLFDSDSWSLRNAGGSGHLKTLDC